MAYGMQAYDNINTSKFVKDNGPRLAAALISVVVIFAFVVAWAIMT